jgi:hypothetical protein
MRMRGRLVTLALLASVGLFGNVCQRPHQIQITSPTGDVTTQSFGIGFDLVGGPYDLDSLSAELNGVPLVILGGPTSFSASVTGGPTVDAGEPLRDDNLLAIEVRRENENGLGQGAKGGLVRAALHFAYDIPKARAYPIAKSAECPVSGPLAHRRVGDYCLENELARFVVQDVTAPEDPADPTPRDLYSVGAFGGNLIDAVQPGNPTTDNFLEFQAMLNIETVANYQSIQIVNDGENGLAAILRACGPDDLLDFANPSSQLIDLGLTPPQGTDDNDQEIEACTTYTLEAGDRHVRVDTEVFNDEPTPLSLLVGDWMNAAGEVDGFFKPGPGVGEGVTSPLVSAGNQGLTWFAETAVEAPDRFEYGYLPRDDASVGGYVVISGVAVIIHDLHPAVALLGVPSPFVVPAGGSKSYTRYFSVGDGSGNSAQELADVLDARPTGTVQGCVSVGGVPAPNAKVSVGTFAGGQVRNLLAHFITDASGCYAGAVQSAPNSVARYGAVAGKQGVPYIGGGPTPPVTVFKLFPAGDVETIDFALPATGHLAVDVVDENGAPVPARITVVGFDPSPEVVRNGQALPGFGTTRVGLLNDVNDSIPFGVTAFAYTGADGAADFDLEPGDYHVFASRGSEYSAWSTTSDGPVTVATGGVTALSAQIARVVDTTGFVSSDFHVHGIASADSQVTDADRAEGFAGEGVDNLISTDHHVHKDYKPTIQALGLDDFLTATIGEEITTFDYGHFNAYPFTIDPGVPSGGSTDWAVAAPPGRDFPSYGAFNLPPAGIFELATTQDTSTPATTVQVNHIGSHFVPLKIDTSLVPPLDGMSVADRANRRLDPASPPLGQLFFPFPALELWNGNDRGHQSEFLDERIGIWMNLLDQDIRTTAIADTDTHTFVNLRSAGARSWTAAPHARDEPASLMPAEVAASVDAGRLVGGQGIYVKTRLLADDGSGAVADHEWGGSTSVSSANDSVTLQVSVQAPTWAPWDTIEIYSNAYGNVSSQVLDPSAPYLYTADPLIVRSEGDCDPSTTGDGHFDVTVTEVHALPAPAERTEVVLDFSFPELTADTWFVAVVRGSDGLCGAMFPIYPDDLAVAPNIGAADPLAALVDGNVDEGGTMALGFTNALYYEH